MRNSKIIKILISAPSDVVDEFRIVLESIKNWNASNSERTGLFLDGIHWTTHSTPKMGVKPQAHINKQIVDTSDVLIAIFHSKLGSSTGKEKSGTVEEIKKFIKSGKPVLLYFSHRPIPREADPIQLKKLNEFQDECKKKKLGLFFEFDSHEIFGRKVIQDISITISEIDTDNQGEEPGKNVIKYQKKDIFESNLLQYDVFIKRLGLEWKIPKGGILYLGDSITRPGDYFMFLKRIENNLWDFYKIFNYGVSEEIGKKIFEAISIVNEVSSPNLRLGEYPLTSYSQDYLTKHKEKVMQLLESILKDLKEFNE